MFWLALPLKKCQNWTFKMNFLCQKSSKSFWFVFQWNMKFITKLIWQAVIADQGGWLTFSDLLKHWVVEHVAFQVQVHGYGKNIIRGVMIGQTGNSVILTRFKVHIFQEGHKNWRKSSPSIWHLLHNVKSMMKILSNFVAFLANINLKKRIWCQEQSCLPKIYEAALKMTETIVLLGDLMSATD